MNYEEIEKYLPKYLSAQKQKDLYEQLRDFPQNVHKIYGTDVSFDDGILQSDMVQDIPFYNLPDTNHKNTTVMVVSNSCDIDPSNKRPIPPKISYIPIIRLDKFVELLKNNDIDEQRIKSTVDSIKKQEKTNMFYLPQGQHMQEESIALFENMLSINRDKFFSLAMQSESKIATLGNYGFYMFLLKLSIHFTRIQESVDRD